MTDELREDTAHVHFKPKWVFELGKVDATLVLKALGGRLANDGEVTAAKELGDRLTRQRAIEVKQYLDPLERAAEASMKVQP